MQIARINFPEKTDLTTLFKFSVELDYYVGHDRLIIDLPPKVFCGPFAMLFLGSKICYLKNHFPQLTVIFSGWESHDYLAHMGFFNMCGFNHGKAMGQAWGSQNYIPISRLERNDLVEQEFDKYEEMQDLLQRRVDRVAKVLSQDAEGSSAMFDALSYSLREVFRNVYEHGGTDSLYYCAQFWPKSRKVEFSVADFGIGIRTGLGENPNFRLKSDKEAIEYSLLPGVSGKTHISRASTTWFNSGYGLYMTSRLARNGGNFVMASGQSAIHLTPKTKTNYLASFRGTILRVNLDVDAIGDVQKRLSEFREDGKAIAEKIKGSGNRPPSAMSLLLRKDYKTPRSTR